MHNLWVGRDQRLPGISRRRGNANVVPPVVGLTTTEVTSVTWQGETMLFSAPVAAGVDATGRPVILTDRAIPISGFSRPSTQDAGGFWKDGAMRKPQPASNTSPQGFDGRIGGSPVNGTGIVAYSHSLNVDPAANGPITIAAGERTSIVKSRRNPAFETTNNYIQAENWATFTFLPPEACFNGMYTPGASFPDAIIRGVGDLRLNALRNLPRPAGWPTNAEILALDKEGWPYFGWRGENLRRFQTAGLLFGENYSSDVTPHASLLLYAAHCTSDPAERLALANAIIRHGLDIDAAHQHGGWNGNRGAGQGALHAHFHYATAFLLGDAAMLARAQASLSNTFSHPSLIAADLEGISVPFPEGSGQKYRNNTTYAAEDIGKPWWTETLRGAQPSARYATISLVTGVIEAFPVLLMQNGPNGETGITAALQGPDAPSNPRRAILQVYDRIRSWKSPERGFIIYEPFRVDFEDAIALWRSEIPAYSYTGTPDMYDNISATAQTFPTAINGGFSWALTGEWAGYTGNLPITSWRTEYSLDGYQWIDTGVSTATGQKTGLMIGQPYIGRFSQQNALGWGRPTQHHKFTSVSGQGTPSVDRHRFTPTGVGVAAGPVNTVPPVLMARRYPLWGGQDFTPISAIGAQSIELAIGKGDWRGFPAPTFEYTWERREGGSLITAVGSTQSRNRVQADSGNELRAGIRASNASLTTPFIYTGWISVPPVNALPPGVYVDLNFSAIDRVDQETVWNTIAVSNGTLRHVPSAVYGTTDADDNFVPFATSAGAIACDKTGSFNLLRLNLGTYPAGSYRLLSQNVIGLNFDEAAAGDYQSGRNHYVRLKNQASQTGAVHFIGGGNVNGIEFTPNTAGTPKLATVDQIVTLTATTQVWLEHVNSSNQATSAGGDVIVTRVRWSDPAA